MANVNPMGKDLTTGQARPLKAADTLSDDVGTTLGGATPGVSLPFHVFFSEDAYLTGANQPARSERGTHAVLAFDGITAEYAYFYGVITPAFDESGGSLTVIIHWASNATSGNVKWNLEIECLQSTTDTDIDSFAAARTTTTATNGTAGVLATTTITFTVAQGDSPSGNLPFRLKLYRDAADAADTLSGDCHFFRLTLAELAP